jgi:hypothetical protein
VEPGSQGAVGQDLNPVLPGVVDQTPGEQAEGTVRPDRLLRVVGVEYQREGIELVFDANCWPPRSVIIFGTRLLISFLISFLSLPLVSGGH